MFGINKTKSTKVAKKTSNPEVVKKPTFQPKVTFEGEGPLSGEYRFKEIRGSVAAESLEEATRKAEDIVTKHPKLTK